MPEPQTAAAPLAPPPPPEDLETLLARQRAAFRQDACPTARQRRERLDRLAHALREHRSALVAAVSRDFGHRSDFETRAAELLLVHQAIAYVRRRLGAWMRPSRRDPGLLLATTSAWVQYQPRGVVGVLSPWNYPLQLALMPLVYALAAGNRVMLKPSEHTPCTASVLRTVLAERFAAEEVAVVTGGADTARAFSRLPFDHLVFTGSTGVGREVMRAAAENLTPVTLELGGKSPAIVSRDVDLGEAAQRLCFGKALNAGQTCVAPDYVLCPRERVDELVDALRDSFAAMYPSVAGNPDYTAIINDRHFQRLEGMVEEARRAGSRVVPLADEAPAAAAAERRMVLTAVLDPPVDSRLLGEEIFGPVLPVLGYERFDEALAFVRDRPHPLALNYFGRDRHERQRVLRELQSGTVCLNDAVFQVAVDDMPFGGVGDSGFGNYHGEEGFRTLSHARGVLSRPAFNTARLFHPPYGTALQRLVMRLFLR